MARTSTAKLRSEVGESREAKISAMVGIGLTNDIILEALVLEFRQALPQNDARRKKGDPPYDATYRQRLQEAIRSVRHKMGEEDADIDAVQELQGESEIKSPDDIELRNIHRFACGVPALDFIYGSSEFVHLSDHPQSKYKTIKGLDGKPRQEWVSGLWKLGDPMIPDGKGSFLQTRGKDGLLISDLDMARQIRQHGLPEGFLSIWAGAPGVGKSRLAVALTKALNKAERAIHAFDPSEEARAVLYLNGEAEESQFRQWMGSDVDNELFKVVSSDQLRLAKVVELVYKTRPRVVIVDSLQMIAEVEKGSRGTKTAMSRFKLLKSDDAAGRPHFIFISQLNKKEELMGSRYLEHMVDFCSRVTQDQGREGQFLFECPRKNRGGPTPRGAIFKHGKGTIECITTDISKAKGITPIKLVTPATPVVIPALNQNAAPTDVDHHGQA